jgi:hypothetical protein
MKILVKEVQYLFFWDVTLCHIKEEQALHYTAEKP